MTAQRLSQLGPDLKRLDDEAEASRALRRLADSIAFQARAERARESARRYLKCCDEADRTALLIDLIDFDRGYPGPH